ncbi:MAG: hypothetical protein LBJ91_04115 [Clostridiales Family XIII bacterium]|jgi:hypothetical protein|nr:hypothetical protein [Clostridiales Family XIII bacterium]
MARVFREKRSYWALKLLLFVAAAVGAAVLVWNVASSLDRSQQDESMKMGKEAIVRATVQCYSLEGRYPPDLGYLERNYGLTLDKGRYVYHYRTIGENIMPRIDLLPLNRE